MKLTTRDKRVLALGFLVALGIVAWSYVLSPMQERWRKARTMLQADRDELAKLQRVAAERHKYVADRERLLEMVHETPDLAASQYIVPPLINSVQRAGQRCGVRITRYEPLMPRIQESYAVYSLTMACQATLEELVNFLCDLQEHRPVIAVERVHIVPPADDATTEDLAVDLLLCTYAVQKIAATGSEQVTQGPDKADIG